jgi:16S rRNA (guanine527-N7)-methyltransferase
LKEPLRQRLDSGLKFMGLYIPTSVQQQLIRYLLLLHRWNRSYNLTAIQDPLEMVSKHLLDSLAVMSYIEGKIVLDVGSGAGLPGIPLALALPHRRFVLLDSNGKKTRFLTHVRIELGLENIEIVNQRVEDYQPGLYFDVIIARAWASAAAMLERTAHLQQPGTQILVMQGKLDVPDTMPGFEMLETHNLEIYGLDAERHLLEITPK